MVSVQRWCQRHITANSPDRACNALPQQDLHVPPDINISLLRKVGLRVCVQCVCVRAVTATC